MYFPYLRDLQCVSILPTHLEFTFHDTSINHTSRWLHAEKAATHSIAEALLDASSTRIVMKTNEIGSDCGTASRSSEQVALDSC
jgi:hypothetical protein